MFKRLLVPLDGSTRAESVLPAAGWFGARLQATVVLYHTLETQAAATIHGEPHLQTEAAATAYLEQTAARLSAQGIRTEQHVHSAAVTDVAGSINVHVTELAADLVFLCAHGHGGWRDLVTGNLAQQVVNHGRVPVFFVRADSASAGFECRKILVPLDGSAVHEPALTVAREIAVPCGAALHLLSVIPTVATLSPERAAVGALLPGTLDRVLELTEQNSRDYLAGLAGRSENQALSITTGIARGDVLAALREAMTQEHADLVVVATHGRRRITAFWEGSLTPKLIANSLIPVLMVRVTGEEAPR